jgi:two-component system, sensor histidine kinase LadS
MVWPNRPLLTLSGLMGLLSAVIGVYVAVVLIIQGNRYARYVAVAWAMVTVGTVATLLAVLGVIEGSWFAENAQHIGFAFETLLLSVALSDRIKREREEREQAQQEAIALTERIRLEREEKIQAQAQAMAVQAITNEGLGQRVLERTAQLERTMRDLEFANVELARSSVTDSLTQVHNRRYFDEAIEKEHRHSARTGVPLAVVLVDIDHFKRVNDTCGHVAGDECLRLVASALRRTAGRLTDLVARYGGEEFVLVLPGSDAGHALLLAERVRGAIEAIEFVHGGCRVPLTASLGVVARVTSVAQPVEDFLAEADAALYRAKDTGRNRVVLAA